MKKNVFKKLMCAVLATACVATAVVPAMADDVVTAEAATKKVTSAYKYHIDGYDKKRISYRWVFKNLFLQGFKLSAVC